MRIHVVMIPGFGGFDALGDLHYYAGLTPIFKNVVTKQGGDLVIHYFDNLPTAAVKTRARKLRLWLSKLVTREEIKSKDKIVLVGHSTGGLDIRHLLLDLQATGKIRDEEGTTGSEILERIRRVVFLSVPHRGSNLADWAQSMPWIELVKRLVRRVVQLDVEPSLVLEPLLEIFRSFGEPIPDLLLAARDVERDIGRRFSDDPWIAAQGRQNYADLNVWLENIDKDFMAAQDLRAGCAGEQVMLDNAIKLMKDAGIVTRSFATLGRCPFSPKDLDEWMKGDSRSVPRMLRWGARRVDGTDEPYAYAYCTCTNGPFTTAGKAVPWLGGRRPPESDELYSPKLHENDGIVNTASMLAANFPGDEPTLVHADHGDVIGHFELAAEVRPNLMRTRYDLLRSGSGFGQEQFEQLWRMIFEFASQAGQ
ncbi:MAG TPA: hypothetical protein VM580_32870 [Labilithrix sp.]|nr:hypothetical protein [Labilithrix sp.]